MTRNQIVQFLLPTSGWIQIKSSSNTLLYSITVINKMHNNIFTSLLKYQSTPADFFIIPTDLIRQKSKSSQHNIQT